MTITKSATDRLSDSREAAEKPTYRDKHQQANREAGATAGALAVTVIVWAVCGFGLSGFDVKLYHTPLWVAAGTLGTWACAIVVSVVLARRFFADFELDDETPPSPEERPASEGNHA